MMKKEVKIGAIMVVFAILILSSAAGNEDNPKVGKEVYAGLEVNDSVRVIIKVKESEKKDLIDSLDEKVKRQIGNDTISAEIDREDLRELADKVEMVEIVPVRQLFLQDSVPLINATDVHTLKMSNFNLTGKGQTICVIDTGVNYSHPALGGCFGEGCKVIGGWDFVNNDNNPMDDHGHGTHVAGIASANGSIKGVAPEANIVALKACSSLGTCSDDNIRAAIDWCVGNYSTYNISVISMSLGGGLYSGYCDYQDDPVNLTLGINNAASKNISVTIASGNGLNNDGVGNATKIASPACITNATPVGAVTKSDQIASYSDRSSILRLFAVGSSINSSCITSDSTSGFCTKSGTSMAAPHAAGAIAIIKQFIKLMNITKTDEQIKDLLNDSGKRITDSATNLNYSRIDVYGAIEFMSYDYISNVLPTNNSYANSNVSFICNVSSSAIVTNLTLNIWNSTALVFNRTAGIGGSFNTTNVSYNLTRETAYLWGCTANNTLGLEKVSENRTINYDITKPELNSLMPVNGSWLNRGQFNVTINEQGDCSYSMNNGANMVMNSSNNLSFNFFDSSLAQGSRNNVTYTCNDTAGNTNSSRIIFFNTDLTQPNITLNNPQAGFSASGTTNIDFGFNVTDNLNISSCNLILDGTTVAANTSMINLTGQNSIRYSVAAGSHSWNVNCIDSAENSANSSTRELSITSPSSESSSGSSGGGGGGGSVSAPNVYEIEENQISGGYSQEIRIGEKVQFRVNSETHNLSIDRMSNSFINITIRSQLVRVGLYVGEEKKIKMDENYNIYIKLNGIKNGKANLTLQEIREFTKINDDLIVKEQEDNEKNIVLNSPSDPYRKGFVFLSMIIIGLILAAILIYLSIAYFRARKTK